MWGHLEGSHEVVAEGRGPELMLASDCGLWDLFREQLLENYCRMGLLIPSLMDSGRVADLNLWVWGECINMKVECS